jgi:murein DD-endopeptidase MepM/ murein hydrolase activator NlpD
MVRSTILAFVVFVLLAVGLMNPWHSDGNGQVTLRENRLENKTEIFVNNSKFSPVTIQFDTKGTNISLSKGNSFVIVVPPQSEALAFSIRPIDPLVKWAFTYEHRWGLGDINARHDPNAVYDLPFQSGSSHKVMQGFNGKFSHFGDSKYAVDFQMPEGTVVTAAREGLVVYMQTGHIGHGLFAAMKDKANVIYILHSDGTISEYAHLQQNGSLVSVGQSVQRGEPIGYSGNTGYSSGPHLHFSVKRLYSVKYNKRQTLPIKFKTTAGEAVVLQQGENYTRP